MSTCSCDASQYTQKCNMCWPGSSGSHLAQDRPVICSDYLRFACALGDVFRCLVCVCLGRGASRYHYVRRAADGMIRSVDFNIQIPKAGLGILSTGRSSRLLRRRTGDVDVAFSVSLSPFVRELWRLGRRLCVDQI